MKKLQYSRIGEDWGENEETDRDQITFTLPPPPVIRRGGVDKVRKRGLMSSSVITDFFSPRPKRRRMDRFDRKSWSDEEGFMVATQEYNTIQYSPSGDDVVEGGRASQEDVHDEFSMDASWEEVATTLMDGLEDDSTNREETRASKDDLGDAMEAGMRTESLLGDKGDQSHQGVTDPVETDSNGGVPGSRKIQVEVREETMVSDGHDETILAPGCALGSTTDHTVMLRPSEEEQDCQFVQSVDAMRCEALPDNISQEEEGSGSTSPVRGQVATKPALEEGNREEDVAEDGSQVTPSIGKNVTARFRDAVGGDDLLDLNDPSSRMEMFGDSVEDQETIDPGQKEAEGIQEASGDMGLPTPSIGQLVRARLPGGIRKDDLLDAEHLPSTIEIEDDADMTPGINEPRHEDEVGSRGAQSDGVMTEPSVVQGGSGRYQPASQLSVTQHGASTGQNNVDNILTTDNLETSAGAGLGQPETQPACSHTRAGVCCLHGEGAKWRWRPIPPHRRTIGPDGKIKKKKYFWQCDLSSRGRALRQSRISWGE